MVDLCGPDGAVMTETKNRKAITPDHLQCAIIGNYTQYISDYLFDCFKCTVVMIILHYNSSQFAIVIGIYIYNNLYKVFNFENFTNH